MPASDQDGIDDPCQQPSSDGKRQQQQQKQLRKMRPVKEKKQLVKKSSQINDILSHNEKYIQGKLDVLSQKHSETKSRFDLSELLDKADEKTKLVDTNLLTNKNIDGVSYVAYSGSGQKGCETVAKVMNEQDKTRQVLIKDQGNSLRAGIYSNQVVQQDSIKARAAVVKSVVEAESKQKMQIVG